MSPLLLAYPGNEALAESLRRTMHADELAFSSRRFPDGEFYVRIESDVQNRSVAIVCSLRDPDSCVLPLVFMADALRDLGALRVGIIAPYLAYMRQDRRFQAGEAITSTSFARVLSTAFDWLVTVDPHLHRRLSLDEIYTIPTAVTHAAPLLASWIRAHVTTPLVVGPDAESEQWVRAVASAVPSPYVVLQKTRRGDRDVSISAIPDADRWSGRTPVMIDDIISSAHTMIEAVRRFADAGFENPVCVGVHGVFAANAYESLLAAGAARVVTTNSIAHPSNDIDLSAVLDEPLKRFL